ncbi:MAG: hypothetical protein K2J39_13105 [Ruminococcus sp.]|nr:hypothetical protein [Ruminococcus sp.]
MSEFDKNNDKKRGFGFGFGVVVGVVVGATSFLANVSEIVQLFNKPEKPSEKENSVAVSEPVEKDAENVVIGKTYVIQNGDDYAEAVAGIADKYDLCFEEAEEPLIQQAYVVDYNEPVFIEDMIPRENIATYGDYVMTFKENAIEETVIEQN